MYRYTPSNRVIRYKDKATIPKVYYSDYQRDTTFFHPQVLGWLYNTNEEV